MQEVWKSAVGFEETYEVSNMGRIRSIDRVVFNAGNGANCKTRGVILKPSMPKKGYAYVGLVKNKTKTTSVKVHRIVAMSFCDGYEIGLEVNHKDGNKYNNRASNLEWVTRSQNIRDTFKRGRDVSGDKNNSSKLKNTDIGVIASLYDSGVAQHIIAVAFGVSQGTISNVIRNKHYKNNAISLNSAIDINTLNKQI